MMRGMASATPRIYSCHVELALDLLGGKWKPVILAHLKDGPLRYGELRARLRPHLSEKMLTQRLGDMEAQGMIARRKQGRRGSPATYRLTPRGEALRPALQALHDWAAGVAVEIDAVVREGAPMDAARSARGGPRTKAR
jgi:DNA-binding HxlR family transcriptional regulator